MKLSFPILIEPTIESTIESSVALMISTSPPAFSVLSAPSTTITKSTRKSLTVLESLLWHRRLARMNPTAMKSLIEGHTHDDSMCTACIQAKHNQRFIRVPVKHRTKRHTRCCMDLANRCTILPAMKYRIKPLSTTYIDSDAMPLVIPKVQCRQGKFETRDQSPA
jgi:hypothetical protein